MNKPKAGIPPDQQKALIKITYRVPDAAAVIDRVLDFSGEERFGNCSKAEEILRENAGDKAETRRLLLEEEERRLSVARKKFLDENPEVLRRYHYLTTEGGLSIEEFWDQHDNMLMMSSVQGESKAEAATIPAPLRRPDSLHGDLAANLVALTDKKEFLVSADQAREIFVQFPKAKELYDQLVPNSISEKNFWRRFFQSQYFSISQGTSLAGGNKHDAVFDTLLSSLEKRWETKPGYLPLDPEIDLTTDYLVPDSGVFAFRDMGNDSSNKREVGGKLPVNQAVAHETLVSRFNNSISNSISATTEDEMKVLNTRKHLLENEESLDPIVNELTRPVEALETVVSKAEIERLRRTRRKYAIHVKSCLSTDEYDQPIQRVLPGLPGAAECLLHMTQELVVPPSAGIETSRKARKLASSAESSEVDELLERAVELLRYFFVSKRDEREKRNRTLQALESLRSQISNASTRMKFQTEWGASFSSVVSMILNANDIHASLLSLHHAD